MGTKPNEEENSLKNNKNNLCDQSNTGRDE